MGQIIFKKVKKIAFFFDIAHHLYPFDSVYFAGNGYQRPVDRVFNSAIRPAFYPPGRNTRFDEKISIPAPSENVISVNPYWVPDRLKSYLRASGWLFFRRTPTGRQLLSATWTALSKSVIPCIAFSLKDTYRPIGSSCILLNFQCIFQRNMILGGSDDDFYESSRTKFLIGTTMSNPSPSIKCTDETQLITIHLPCRLAERVDKCANVNGSTITNVVIEALDAFLSGQNMPPNRR